MFTVNVHIKTPTTTIENQFRIFLSNTHTQNYFELIGVISNFSLTFATAKINFVAVIVVIDVLNLVY